MRKLSIVFGLLVAVLGSSYYYTQASVLSYHQSQYSNTSCNCTTPTRYVDPKQRYVSQGCCADQKRAIRPFSDRIGVYRYQQPSAVKVARYGLDLSHPTRRHDVWYHSQYQKAPASVSARQIREIARVYYGGFQGANARAENTVPSDRHVIRHGEYKPKEYPYGADYAESTLTPRTSSVYKPNYAHYQNTGIPFSVDLKGTSIVQTGENAFEDKRSSLAFRIVREGSCSGSFQQCVQTYSRSFKQSQKLGVVDTLYARFNYEKTIDLDGNRYPVYTEGFMAQGYGTNNVYYLYNMMDPSDGSIVRIEAVSLQRDHGLAAQSIKDVAETFLFKPGALVATLLDS